MKRNVAFNGGVAERKVTPSVGDARLVCLQVCAAPRRGLARGARVGAGQDEATAATAAGGGPVSFRPQISSLPIPCRTRACLTLWTSILTAPLLSCSTRRCRWGGPAGGYSASTAAQLPAAIRLF